eukprot:6185122-Pleurochrysis_carterae.AAC.2
MQKLLSSTGTAAPLQCCNFFPFVFGKEAAAAPAVAACCLDHPTFLANAVASSDLCVRASCRAAAGVRRRLGGGSAAGGRYPLASLFHAVVLYKYPYAIRIRICTRSKSMNDVDILNVWTERI